MMSVLAVISVISVVLALKYSYIESLINKRKEYISNEAVLMSAEFTDYSDLSDARNGGMYETLMNYSALNQRRIRVVDRKYMVSLDTYAVDNGKTIISSKVIDVYESSKAVADYNRKSGSIEAVSPVYNSEGTVIAVLVVNFDISDIRVLAGDAFDGIYVVLFVVITFIIVSSIVISYFYMRHYNKALKDITSREWIDVFKMHAEDGVDFMTIHCGINRNTAERFKAMKRKMNIVSRGGSLIFAWMEATGNENPFFEYYDEILDICNEYDVTLSLGDACRPGCLADASDISQIEELVTLGELTARAWKKDVQVMIEGPGHMPMDQIQANMKIQQTICHGAPFYVLGPLVTDIAPGYDHITSAIGGAIAAASGASFLCYVTPAEHLRLPNVDDVKEGIMASKIAAHAADIAKGVKGAMDWDNQMAAARQKLDWEKQFELALDPEKARRYRAESTPEREDTCTMCGKMCSVRNMNAVLAGEDVDVI